MAHPVHRMVGLQQELVAHVADVREPAHVLDHGVEFVAVDDENLAPVPRAVHGARHDFHIAEFAGKLGDEFIVVARNIDQACSFARFAQEFLHHVVVRLRPVTPAAQGPDVDQVADQIERFEFMIAEELDQRLGLGTTCAQMHVGNPAGPMGGHRGLRFP